MTEPRQDISALLSEHRVFEPPADFTADAIVKDRGVYEHADADFEGFWAEQAEQLSWFKKWDTVMDWTPPTVKWFEGGKLNASYNCLDRHVEAGGGDKVAYHWEGEPGEQRTITYAELLDEVGRFANALKALGVGKGDRVAIYLGMIPELPVAMLACARIGAIHSVVFGGFSADSLRDRIIDAQARVLITSGWRLPARLRRGAQGRSRRGARGCALDRARDHRPAHRSGASVHAGSRPLVPRADRAAVARVPRRGDGRGGRALHALHERDHGQAEGHRPHDRRLHDAGRGQPPDDLRHPRPGRVLVLGRHRLGDRPLLHRLRAAREPHDERHVRGRPGLARQGPLVAARSSTTRSRSCTRRRRRSARSCAGAPSTSRSTISRRCGSSARSASRSTPRPGCGTRR